MAVIESTAIVSIWRWWRQARNTDRHVGLCR